MQRRDLECSGTSGSTPRSAGARACSRPARSVDASRIRPRPRGPAENARDAYSNTGWRALLAALSFILTTDLSDRLFGDVPGALQALAYSARCLALSTPHDAFLTTFTKAASYHASKRRATASGAGAELPVWLECSRSALQTAVGAAEAAPD